MPPHVPRKRLLPSNGEEGHIAKRPRKANNETTPVVNLPARKPTLWDDLDSGSKKGSAEKTRAALQQMQEDGDDSTSLSSLSDAQFEDVPTAEHQKTGQGVDGSDDDEDMEFEDVPSHKLQQHQHQHHHHQEPEPEEEQGDLELTLYQDNRILPLASELGKKGPSKREKAIRIATHCIHVQFLLWHNAVRNSWLCDQEVHAILLSHLPARMWEEVDRWKRNSGLEIPEYAYCRETSTKKNTKGKGKGKGKKKLSRPSRDWSEAADRLEKGVPDMSQGDPLFRLMKSLIAWWKQRFRSTAPGLRKWGYMNARRLGKLRAAFEKEEHDTERFGERVENIDKFRQLAQGCVGSRDIGAQLFTALLRALGLEARMVANVQPLGFSWSKTEDADEEIEQQANGKKTSERAAKTKGAKKRGAPIRPARRQRKKSDSEALKIDLDDSDEYAELLDKSEDSSSIADATEDNLPKQPKSKLYDKDLEFPHYWTEILSPVTNKYITVDPIVKCIIGTNRDLIESLEPRGGKADKAKQMIAYCVAFSQDGTAKDVTVRYLRKQIFPGKTKGVRMPEQKIPIYNKHGKIRRYDEFNWFKSIMRGYARGDKSHPITEADEWEESTDLKPIQPEKKEVKEGEETLQYYKTSKEYVLQRHLKREEALLPDAAPVKVFRNKGKGSKVEEEDVYLRKDVVSVKSAETWHKQGRAPIDGAQPLKHAPYRAATTNRRREIAEAEAATGQKVLQPLYSFDQTDWIIPDPIKDGIIPKNEYGNIDMFAEHMCPEGAVHVPYRGAVRVCKRLEIDFAEAVVGFEFGHRMAVPVIQGVVIAQEHHDRLVEELEKDEAERARKEDEKRRKAALSTWRRFLMGLRIADRIRQEYGHLDESMDVLDHGGEGQDNPEANMNEEDMGGGFLPEGYEEEEPEKTEPRQTSSFFAAPNPSDDDEGEDPFQVEYHGRALPTRSHDATSDAELNSEVETGLADVATETSKKVAPKSKSKPLRSNRRRTRRNRDALSDEDRDEDDEDFNPSDGDS